MAPTVLIAAYDPWFLQLLRMYSERCGFTVVQVHEGQDVIPMVQKEKPAVILMQANLPGDIHGGDVLKVLQREDCSKQIPVLLFSWSQRNAADGEVGGVRIHFKEPVSFDLFVETMQSLGLSTGKR